MAEGNGRGSALERQARQADHDRRRAHRRRLAVERFAGAQPDDRRAHFGRHAAARARGGAADRLRAAGHPARDAQRHRSARTIAYLVDEISTSPHPVVNLDGARDFAFEQDFLVAAHVTRSNPELEEATIAAIKRDKSVIGVIYSTIFTRSVTLPPSLEDIPTVLLNCYAEPRQHISIVPGEVAGGFAATAHLTGSRPSAHRLHQWRAVDGCVAVDRLKGYRQALATADIAFDEALVRNGDWLPLTGYHHACELLALEPAADRDPLRQRSDGDRRAGGGQRNGHPRAGRRFRSWAMTTRNWRATPTRRCRRWCCPTTRWASARPKRCSTSPCTARTMRPMTIKIDGPLVRRASTGPAKA